MPAEEIVDPNPQVPTPQPPTLDSNAIVVEFTQPKVVSRIPERVTTTQKLTIIRMVDDPVRKTVEVYVKETPGRILLWEGDAYDAIGNWTNQDVIDRLTSMVV